MRKYHQTWSPAITSTLETASVSWELLGDSLYLIPTLEIELGTISHLIPEGSDRGAKRFPKHHYLISQWGQRFRTSVSHTHTPEEVCKDSDAVENEQRGESYLRKIQTETLRSTSPAKLEFFTTDRNDRRHPKQNKWVNKTVPAHLLHLSLIYHVVVSSVTTDWQPLVVV